MLNNFPKSKIRENWYSFIKFEVETKYKVHFKQKSTEQKFKMASLSVKRSTEAKYYKFFHLTSKFSHYGIMQPFCDVINFFQLFLLISKKHQTFIRTWIISRHSFERKNISDFFRFTFHSHERFLRDWNQFFFCANYFLRKTRRRWMDNFENT